MNAVNVNIKPEPEQQQQQQQQLVAYLEYVASNPLERRAMEIAKDHLGSSFDIARSNGYRSWVQKQK